MQDGVYQLVWQIMIQRSRIYLAIEFSLLLWCQA